MSSSRPRRLATLPSAPVYSCVDLTHQIVYTDVYVTVRARVCLYLLEKDLKCAMKLDPPLFLCFVPLFYSGQVQIEVINVVCVELSLFLFFLLRLHVHTPRRVNEQKEDDDDDSDERKNAPKRKKRLTGDWRGEHYFRQGNSPSEISRRSDSILLASARRRSRTWKSESPEVT